MAEEVRLGEPCIEVHQAMIYDRGGTRRLWQLVDVAQVQWRRARSKQSTADLTITGEACRDQADVLALIEPRRHELVLFRNGERVWEGPIVQVGWFKDRATILAHDVTEYIRYTPLSKDWPNIEGGGPLLMTDRVRDILEYELTTPYVMSVGTGEATHDVTVPRWENLEAPANILPFLDVRNGGVLTRSDTLGFELTVFEHLQNLARSGLDYTTVGRKILIWDSADTIGRTRTLTDNDFYGDIQVYASGTDHFSVAHVVASAPMELEVPTTPPVADEPEPPQLVTLRENLFIDPRARTLTNKPWGKDYDGPGNHTYQTITDPDGTTWFQLTYVSTKDWAEFPFYAPMEAHLDYRFRCRVRCSVPVPNARIRISHTGGNTSVTAIKIPLPAGESIIDVTQRFESDPSPNTCFFIDWEGDGDGNLHEMQGRVLEFTEVSIERSRTTDQAIPYFDGETEDTEEFFYSWTGAADASSSIQEGVVSENAGSDIVVGNAGGENDFYGVWTQVFTTENEEGTAEPSQEELNGQAGRKLVGRTPVPLEIRMPEGGSIRPSHDLTVADLVPGVEVPVLAVLNLRKVSQLQRLEALTVTETSTVETVGITLSPAGDVTGTALEAQL